MLRTMMEEVTTVLHSIEFEWKPSSLGILVGRGCSSTQVSFKFWANGKDQPYEISSKVEDRILGPTIMYDASSACTLNRAMEHGHRKYSAGRRHP